MQVIKTSGSAKRDEQPQTFAIKRQCVHEPVQIFPQCNSFI